MAEKCCYCGENIEEKEYGAVKLKDGQSVCRDCADRTRILYPLQYSKELGKSDIGEKIGDKIYYDTTISGRRIDPLLDLTSEEAIADSRQVAWIERAGSSRICLMKKRF